MAEGAWRCSQCGTVNEPVANACRTCGRWPSLFELEGTLVDTPSPDQLDDRLPAPTADLEEVDLQPAPFEPHTLPDPTLVTDRHKDDLAPEIEGVEEDTGQTEQRSPWQVLARLIVPIGVVLYILVTTLVDR